MTVRKKAGPETLKVTEAYHTLSLIHIFRRCEEAGVDPHKHLLLAHDIILSAAVERYEDTHENRLPVIGLKDTDFVFDEYKSEIIDKDAEKASQRAKTCLLYTSRCV